MSEKGTYLTHGCAVCVWMPVICDAGTELSATLRSHTRRFYSTPRHISMKPMGHGCDRVQRRTVRQPSYFFDKLTRVRLVFSFCLKPHMRGDRNSNKNNEMDVSYSLNNHSTACKEILSNKHRRVHMHPHANMSEVFTPLGL